MLEHICEHLGLELLGRFVETHLWAMLTLCVLVALIWTLVAVQSCAEWLARARQEITVATAKDTKVTARELLAFLVRSEVPRIRKNGADWLVRTRKKVSSKRAWMRK